MRILSLSLLIALVACASETLAFPINFSFFWRRATVPFDKSPVRYHRRFALNDTVVVNGTSVITLTKTVTQVKPTTLYTAAVEINEDTTTITEQVTLYVTKTYNGDSATTIVSQVVQTITETLTYAQTVAAYLDTTSPLYITTLSSTSASSETSTASPTPTVTSADISSDRPAGTYTTDTTITVPVTTTVTRTIEYMATITDNLSSTRYIILRKSLTATHIESIVKPTNVKYVVGEVSSTYTTYSLSSVASVGDDGDVTEIVISVPATVTDIDTTTSTLTQFITIFRTRTICKATTNFLATPYTNSTFVSSTVSAVSTTPTSDLTTITTASSTPSYSLTTTIFEYVTVDAADADQTSSVHPASTSNSTLHWRRHRTRSRGMLSGSHQS
ncbi:uncharacterized protein V1513DRAFT_483379 [Lipomyces chichibuensis]|uniref:uncharacterized protein n=1 Tax=Lipomyces chichibuensis TaxID=1546026 RepID=UPI003343CB08